MRSLAVAFAGLCISSALAQGSFETKPDIHGDMVVYTAEGDLWLGSLGHHVAHRLTSDPGTETDARFSPDGKWIAFSAQYEGGTDVYKMPVEGGPPKRLTYDPSGAEVLGWSPDGASILFRSGRDDPFRITHLYLVPAGGGLPTRLPVPRGAFGSLAPNDMLAYVPSSFEWANWFHYRGGGADKIWLADLKNRKFRELTRDLSVDTTPVWCGGKIFFVSERSGSSDLWECDTSGDARQCTSYTQGAVRYPSSDGQRVIFQHGPGLAVFDPATRATTELRLEMASDKIHEIEQRVTLASQVGPATLYTNGGSIGTWGNGIALGPTGKRVLLEARGQIVSVASSAGDMRVLEKKPGTRVRFPTWSPDGKRFAFISDRTGENEVWIGDAAGGGQPKQLTQGLAANPLPSDWSPDGKWIAMFDRNARLLLIDAGSGAIKVLDRSDRAQAYDGTPGTIAFSPDSKLIAFSHVGSNWEYGIALYEIASGKKQQVTDWRISSYAPAFDTTGKFLLFLADNNLEPTMFNLYGKYYLDNTTRVEMLALTKDAKSPFLPKDDEEGPAADEKQKAEEKTAKTPAPTAVDWDGLGARIIQAPLPAGHYSLVDSAPGRILALEMGDNPSPDGPSAGTSHLISFDLESRATSTVISGIDAFQKSLDNKKILYAAGRSISVHDLTPASTSMDEGALNLSSYSITYEPVPEWRQVFEESWRVARDFYYDPNMHGLDWNKVRHDYGAQLPLVGDRRDLSRLLADMVSEPGYGPRLYR